MATTNRYYIVEDATSQALRLVQATSQAQARNWVARHQYKVKVASATDVVDTMTKGVMPETADAEQAELVAQEPLEVTGTVA
jgi:hypothetical protein